MTVILSHLARALIVVALLDWSTSDTLALQNGNQVTDRSSAAQRCAALKNAKNLPNPTTVITSATLNAATGTGTDGRRTATATLPEHCEVFGKLNERTGIDGQPYAIKFHMRLPTVWNGRFYFQGGGGLNGVVGDALGSVQDPTDLLARGYAIVSQDAGHDNAVNNDPARGGPASFGLDPQARIDMGYNSYIQVTNTAKGLISSYYGHAPEKSYFSACSEGGREGVMLSQRFPDAFDGILSKSPMLRIPQHAVAAIRDSQAFAAVARSMNLVDANGQPAINKTFTENDLKLVSDAVLAACDTLDGLADGMVQNFTACKTSLVRPKLSAITCRGPKTEGCLSPIQVEAIETVFGGTRTSSGVQIHPGYAWDTGLTDSANIARSPLTPGVIGSWRDRKLGRFDSPVNGGQSVTLALALGNILVTPPAIVASSGGTPVGYGLNVHIDDAMRLMANTTDAFREPSLEFLKADTTDVAAFKSHGGKLLIVHGVSDSATSVLETIDWWDQVNARNGDRAKEFVRLFPVPGMNHCGGGNATDQFDAFDALVSWVETGVAPDRILATAPPASPWPGRTRPLCVYPAYAHYTGTGSIEDAANFACR
jgi:feruloyl esterase